MFNEYGKDIKYWLTINEQNTMILHPGAIGLPPNKSLPTKKKRALSNESSHDACTGKSYETLS